MSEELTVIENTSCCTPEAVGDACCAPTDACCSTDEACCQPTENCYEPVSAPNSARPVAVSVAIFVSLIASFVISDYFLGSFIASHLSGFSTNATDSISFFISHSIGLISLLGAITTLAVYLRSFIEPDKVRSRMDKVGSLRGHGIAAGIGMATPFCSCSAVPVFTGFVRGGVPVSQAISFLVASPLVNEIAVTLLATSVGWAIAGAYASMGFAIAVLSGVVLRRFAKPSLTEVSMVKSLNIVDAKGNLIKPSTAVRLDAALKEARDTVKTTFVFILIGVAVGSIIHGWVPASTIETIASWGPVVGVLAATIIGVPLYSGIATVIPIISALADKGMPMGTLLAFAMSVTALSFPEALLLRKVMKPKLLTAYFATVTIGIILVGITFNLIL